MADQPPVIVKVGGSLYDLPDLGPRLVRFLNERELRPALVVPGGGALVEPIRQFDRLHGLGEEACHWLAVDTLTIAARFLAGLIPGSELVGLAEPIWQRGIGIVDAGRFIRLDEGRPGALPHCWQVSSDSIAVRLAAVCRARRLILLKSVSLSDPVGRVEASRQGLVDAYFPEVLKQCHGLEVEVVNLRTWPA
jgi:5-(aminomethyl)-3-furanmethanol phosphate kinase